MGGYGSGRPRRRRLCEEVASIDLANPRHRNQLRQDGEWMRIRTTTNGRIKVERIQLVWSQSRLGRRPWFACPVCGRGCRVLYRTLQLKCRRCAGLLYESQRIARWQSKLRMSDKIQDRISKKMGTDLVEGVEFPPKPKRMRWSTYRALQAQFDRASDTWAVGLMRYLGVHG